MAGVYQVDGSGLVPHIETVPAQTQAQREAASGDCQPLLPEIHSNFELKNLYNNSELRRNLSLRYHQKDVLPV